jgi:hypothetical protein
MTTTKVKALKDIDVADLQMKEGKTYDLSTQYATGLAGIGHVEIVGKEVPEKAAAKADKA